MPAYITESSVFKPATKGDNTTAISCAEQDTQNQCRPMAHCNRFTVQRCTSLAPAQPTQPQPSAVIRQTTTAVRHVVADRSDLNMPTQRRIRDTYRRREREHYLAQDNASTVASTKEHHVFIQILLAEVCQYHSKLAVSVDCTNNESRIQQQLQLRLKNATRLAESCSQKMLSTAALTDRYLPCLQEISGQRLFAPLS